MNYKFIFPLIVLAVCSCQEAFDITTESSESRLVVNGRITSEYTVHQVDLTLSGGLTHTAFQKVSGALVSIVEGGSHVIPLVEDKPGIYLTDSVAGIPGENYTLIIEWNNQIYRGSDSLRRLQDEVLPINISNLGQFREYEFRRHHFGLNTATREVIVIEPREPKLELDTARAGLTIGVKLLPGGTYQFTKYNHPRIEVNGLLNFEDGKYFGFKEGATVRHQVLSLSDQYYEYLRSVFIETEWRGTLFDTPPANVISNFNNGALGYFSAHDVTSSTYILD